MEPSVHFAKPSLIETVSEIHFDLGDGSPWRPEAFGDLFRAFEKCGIRHMSPVAIIEGTAGPVPGGVAQVVKDPVIRMRYSTDPTLVYQVSPGLFTANRLDPYPGWGVFLDDIKKGWNVVVETLGPSRIARIGLRFINRIPRVTGKEPAGTWFAPSPFYPERLRECVGRCYAQFNWSPRSGVRILVKVGEEAGGSMPAALLFDLDTVSDDAKAPTWEAIASTLEELHTEIWNVFSSALTPDYRRLLGEREVIS